MRKSLIALVCLTTVAFVSPLFADDASNSTPHPYKEARDKMKSMSKEDKKSILEDAKAKWEKLSEEEKAAFREKVKEFAEKRKARLEKKCEELKTNADQVYVKIYAYELVKEGKAAK